MLQASELTRKLAGVRLLSLDIDGVLTDGGLYYTDSGDELRKFNVKDGMGIKAVLRAGVPVCLISASISPAIQHRGRRLGIAHVFTGIEEKLPTLEALCGQLGIGLADVAHMADDVNDLPVLGKVGLPLAPADAVAEVKASAAYVSQANGGCGAVREICDLLIQAKGKPAARSMRKGIDQ